MLELLKVTRRFGKTVAVQDLSLSLGKGELFAFLGPNGAGKTTTIKMLVGLLRPSSGKILIGGLDVTEHPRECAQLIGYVPDQPFLYEKLSGREFLEFVGQIRGMPRAEIDRAIREQAERFELESFLDDLVETYSHGMRQRTVFAAALLHRPPILIVDEPMVGLDPKSSRLVKDLMQQWARSGGLVFMSIHTLSVAEEIASRIGIIHRGRLLFDGTVEELRRQMASQDESLEAMFLQLTLEEKSLPSSAQESSTTPVSR
jgi:ABC-2 type transport system ATP-binding protein